jgi:hypothetical protein
MARLLSVSIPDELASDGIDVLVSGDRPHLLPVGEHRGIRIITPQALLAELAGGGSSVAPACRRRVGRRINS